MDREKLNSQGYIQMQDNYFPSQIEQTGRMLPTNENIIIDSVQSFISSWIEDFTERMLVASKSKKRDFSFYDAKRCKNNVVSRLDKLLIAYLDYIRVNPLQQNDYFKYADSYFKGKKLNPKYFKHDLDRLQECYEKIDKNKLQAKKEGKKTFNFYSKSFWENYVLYMMLKLEGVYIQEFDSMFNVIKKNHREYNPLTNIPKLLRQTLPFYIKEYDIKQANPSFIFQELNMAPFDVYEKLGGDRNTVKKSFNMLLNMHDDSNMKITDVRKKLFNIYGNRVEEVITEERFYNAGLMQKEMARYEEIYIEKFVKANGLINYVRLHDSVVVPADINCDMLHFDNIKFGQKTIDVAEIKNNKITFYDHFFKTSPARYSKFFKQEGFVRVTKSEKDELTIIKNENKILKPFNHNTDTPSFLSSQINEFHIEPLQDVIAKDIRQRIKQGFLLLPGEPMKLQRDTKNAVYIPFKNGVAKITAKSVEMISYNDKELDFFVEHETLKHDFHYEDSLADKSNFKDFLFRAVAGCEDFEEHEENISAFCQMIGYMISNYKDPSMAYAIILSDAGAKDNIRNGRRGKGLIQNALVNTRVSAEKSGSSFDTSYRHKYADLKQEHDVLIIDDVPASLNYNSFYSDITTSIPIEGKGVNQESIPFNMAPKFIFSSNYAIRYDKNEASTNNRFMEFQLSNYWNINNTPRNYYKQNFFKDWNFDEWNQFYCFMAECVKMFLDFGLEKIIYDKDADNYNAYFHNDGVEQEFERIFDILTQRESFRVSDFLKIYQNIENPLRFEKFFHQNNTKKLIEIYLKKNNGIDIEYKESEKKWIVKNYSNSNEYDI